MTDAKRTKYDMDTLCVNNIRALSADVVQGAKSGHPGAPMGCAPVRSFIFTFFANERLVVGARWRSQFEWFAHEKLAKKAGVIEEAIQGIKTSRAPEDMCDIMSEDQRAVYKYATELHDRTRVSNKTHEDALKAVGSEQALIDLVFTMGFYHQISMTLNAFNIPLPPGEELPFDEEETDGLTP